MSSGSGVRPSGRQAPLDEPLHRAARPQLDPRRRPRRAVAQLADELGVAERGDRGLAMTRPGGRRGAQPLALGRRDARPADLAERAHPPALRQRRGEEVADVREKERRHGLVAVVGGLVPGEVQALLGPRDRRVEEVALGAEVVAAAQAQAGRGGDPLALGVAEERLGARHRREDALLQAAREQRPHPARAQRERLGHRHPARARPRAAAHLEVLEQRDELRRASARACGRRRRSTASSSSARRPATSTSASCAAGPREHLGRPPPRRREQRGELLARAGEQLGGAAALGGAHAIDGARASSARPPTARAPACAVRTPAWRAATSSASASSGRRSTPGVRSHASRSAARASSSSAQRSSATRPRPSAVWPNAMRRSIATGTPSAPKTSASSAATGAGSRSTTAISSGRVALVGDEARDLRRDELELGALAAALQERDRVAGVDRVGLEQAPVGGQLEELALEVVQRRCGPPARSAPRARFSARCSSGRSSANVVARPENAIRPGLVGERQHDLRAGRGERLDGIALQRREVVEAVDEDGRRAPRGRVLADGVERGGGVQRLVAAAEAVELAPVGGVQAGDLVGVGAAPVVARGPRAQRLREALRRDALLLELVDEAQQRPREAGGPRRAGERAQRRRGDGSGRHALAGERRQRPAADPAAARDLVDEPPEAHDLRAEDDAAGASSPR